MLWKSSEQDSLSNLPVYNVYTLESDKLSYSADSLLVTSSSYCIIICVAVLSLIKRFFSSPQFNTYIRLLSSSDGCITAAGTHKSDCSSERRGCIYHFTTIGSFSSHTRRNSRGYRTSSTSTTTNVPATMASIVSSVRQILIWSSVTANRCT